MTTLVPAILATSEAEYKQKLDLILAQPEFVHGWVQIDLTDNKFVQNQTIGPDVIAKHLTTLRLEAQLMVEYPDDWIDQLVKINVKRIVFPIESAGVEEKITQIKAMGLQVGLSLNPETEVAKVWPLIQSVDVVLIMSVHPGFGGQDFLPQSVARVREIHDWGTNVRIGVDGGVSPANARDLAVAGADYLVVGSHLLEGNIDENLQRFRQAFQI